MQKDLQKNCYTNDVILPCFCYRRSGVSNRNGFTLIELLVVISILILFTGGAIAGYSQYYSRQIVAQSGQELIAALRAAQKSANVGDKPAACGTNAFYSVRVRSYPDGTSPASSYAISSVCGEDDTVNIDEVIVQLPSTVVVNTFNTVFYTPNRAVRGTGGSREITIHTNAASGYEYVITLSASGAVEEGALEAF